MSTAYSPRASPEEIQKHEYFDRRKSAGRRKCAGSSAKEFRNSKNRAAKRSGSPSCWWGEDPASQVYVRNKIRACEEVGIRSFAYRLPETATQGEVEALVDELVASENVHGILVQLPLPAHLNERSIHAPHPRRQRT